MSSNSEMSLVIKGSVWLYIGGLLSSFFVYIYWIIASFLVEPNIIGVASSVIAFQGLVLSIISLGLPSGLTRYIGQSKGKKDHQLAFSFFLLSSSLLTIVTVIFTLFLLSYSLLQISIFGLNSVQLLFAAILILLGFAPPLFMSLFNSLLRTDVTAKIQIISSVFTIVLGVSFLILGFSIWGLMIGFVMGSFISNIFFLYSTIRFYRDHELRIIPEGASVVPPIKAGLATWVPTILTILGQSLAILFVYRFTGDVETGLYFMAYAIATIVFTLPASIQSLMFPVLSGMEHGRKTAILRSTQFAMAITIPLAWLFFLYSYVPFMLLGPNYLAASPLLAILVLSALISPIVAGYQSYIYATGRYQQLTAIGIVANISRIILYIILGSQLGPFGIALAYTIGTALGLISVALFAHSFNFNLEWRKYFLTIIIPVPIIVILFVFGLPWVLGLPLVLVFSFVTYARLGIITKNNLLELSQAFFSMETITKYYGYFKPVLEIIFGD